MSYALLWIEGLLASLLWIATILAFAAHFRRKSSYSLVVFFIGIVPCSVAVIALCGLAAALKFGFQLQDNWLGYAVSLFVAYSIGVALLIFAAKRAAPGLGRVAATWPRIRLVCGLLIVLGIACMTLWNMDLEVRARGENLKNEAGAIMLSISPPVVGDAHNAALMYEKAFAQLAADKSLAEEDSPISHDEVDANNPAVAALLDRHDSTIKLLRRAATMPDCRFDHDYAHPSISMLLPELSRGRTAAKLLSIHARSEHAKGNVESSLVDLNAIFQLGRAVGGEPILVSFLVSAGLDGIAIKSLQDVLPSVTKQGQLASLDIGDGSSDARLLVRSLQGEEAFGLSMFGDLAGNRTTLAELTGVMNSNGTSPRVTPIIEPAGLMLWRIFLMSDDVANYRQLLEGYQRSAAEPYYKAPNIVETRGSFRSRGLMTSIIAPALSKMLITGARTQAAHSAAQTAIAMTRYRLDHGGYPASIDLLVPDYLDEIPADPFDGKPMRLIHRNDQWIIYSIGPDGKDDGGAPYDSASQKGDIPFILKAVK